MLHRLTAILILLSAFQYTYAQTGDVSGLILHGKSKLPLEGVTVATISGTLTTTTNERGKFYFRNTGNTINQLQITAIGYESKTISVSALEKDLYIITLAPRSIQLKEVTVSGNPADQYKPISQTDIELRGINHSQEVLRMVPGLFIGQHAGGGKAEQIFLRGFDLDHGTDIQITVDGMPVNMVSHAHGQGYADLHFLIPELINKVDFKKGTYYPEKGNFTTTGYVDFKTFNTLSQNVLKAEAGMFNTYRGLAMINLLGKKAIEKQQSAYIAGEYMHSQGYFDNPQDFNRFNVFGKYFGKISPNTNLSFSASAFSSKWNASGQIPDRAYESGMIGFYGAIDPNEGGKTSRINANTSLSTSVGNSGLLKNQIFYTRYGFELYSNFTFFKEDPVNGDQIRQKEDRDIFGYNGSYSQTNYLGKIRLSSEIGATIRVDRTHGAELSRTKNRSTTLQGLKLGDIAESNAGAYISETFQFSKKFTVNTGLRYDHFNNKYKDRLSNNLVSRAQADILSPKLNFYYHLNNKTQFYLTTGRGFHSNDTRVVAPRDGLTILPAAYGADLGTVLKPANNLLINAALWYLWLEQEFVYVGDEGVVEPSGKSRRYGLDLSIRYQPLSSLYFDVDLNYSKGRAVDEPKGSDRLPLAPVFTSIGGITLKTTSNINASLRYRYMGDRPANEDNSVVANGYFITDALLNYKKEKYEIAVTIQNIFNTKWKETQFDTESRLQQEPVPISEIHFTPGTPFALKLSLSYFF